MNNCFRYLTKGGGSSGPTDVTLGNVAYVGSALPPLTFVLSNLGLNVLDFTELGGSVTSVVFTGATSEAIQISGFSSSVSFAGATLTDVALSLTDVSTGASFTCPNGLVALVWGGETTTTGLGFQSPPVTLTLNCAGPGATPITFSATFGAGIPAASVIAWDLGINSCPDALPYLASQTGNIGGGTVNFGATPIGRVVGSASVGSAGGTGYTNGAASLLGSDGSTVDVELFTTDGVVDNLNATGNSSQNWGTAEAGSCTIVQSGGSGGLATVTLGDNAAISAINAVCTVTYTYKP